LLPRIAYDVRGDEAVALTAMSASMPRREFEEACQVAEKIGAKQIILESHE
jgi:uncharacterized protein